MTDEFNTDIYYDDDADGSYLENATVAVLGYGSQGHAHALNLNDSGVDVVVGLREDSSSRDAAEADGLDVTTPVEAASQADVISVLVPDTVQPAVYADIESELEEGNTLQFAHGFNIHYNQIQPPEGIDVTMIAPKSPGHLVRRNYENDEGTPDCSRSTRMKPAMRRSVRSRTRRGSAVLAPASSRRASARRPRRTSSASRPSSVAASPN